MHGCVASCDTLRLYTMYAQKVIEVYISVGSLAKIEKAVLLLRYCN